MLSFIYVLSHFWYFLSMFSKEVVHFLLKVFASCRIFLKIIFWLLTNLSVFSQFQLLFEAAKLKFFGWTQRFLIDNFDFENWYFLYYLMGFLQFQSKISWCEISCSSPFSPNKAVLRSDNSFSGLCALSRWIFHFLSLHPLKKRKWLWTVLGRILHFHFSKISSIFHSKTIIFASLLLIKNQVL